MHDGSLATLEEVIEYYDRGGNQNRDLDPEIRRLRLTTPEKKSLIAFLHGLNGTSLDTRAQSANKKGMGMGRSELIGQQSSSLAPKWLH